MGKSEISCKYITCYLLPLLLLTILNGCRSTKYIPEGEYLLWKNKVELRSDKVMTNRGEIKENLYQIIQQKTNSNYLSVLPIKVPKKLWSYNRRYNKLKNRPDSLLPKTVERPTIYDSAKTARSVTNMKSYLFNQGYFYAKVTDTIIYRKKKAIAVYRVNAGANYIINRTSYDVDDSAIADILKRHESATFLTKGKEFTYSMLEEERSRIAALIANHGYRRFSLDNITFELDTMNKALFRVASSPFENAVNFISQTKSNKKSTLDIVIRLRQREHSNDYEKYTVSSVTVYPDFRGSRDIDNPKMLTQEINGVKFRYHEKYVHANVLYEHIFINPGNLYSKSNEDKTTAKLGELGIFQSIRVQFNGGWRDKDSIDCNIFLTKAKKYDFSTNFEVSNGTTYALGNSLSLNYRNKNFLKGANILAIRVNGGLETYYNDNIAENIYDRFRILTRYYGANGSIDFPKFLAPIASTLFTNSNLPHTIVGIGENVIDRVNYFRLANTSANFSYSWHETDEKTWGLTPAFVNLIRVPKKTDSFQNVLNNNRYLFNSYQESFIEGENISFRYDNNAKKHGLNYSYIRISLEEAGSILRAIDNMGIALDKVYKKKYAQYTKIDFDARHYFTMQRSVVAVRFYGGVGTPYGNSSALPYIKQYFAGGPYSLRGWRIRTLGPGSFADTSQTQSLNLIDRTGDIKLELNGEYRFAVAPLFAGAIKMNGAIFADAGNIWLANKDASYPGGELALDKIGQDIAADMGMGVRFDIASFLTLRVDAAVPVKKPNIKTNKGWVFKDINFSDPTWRSDNIIFNLSIGYPF